MADWTIVPIIRRDAVSTDFLSAASGLRVVLVADARKQDHCNPASMEEGIADTASVVEAYGMTTSQVTTYFAYDDQASPGRCQDKC